MKTQLIIVGIMLSLLAVGLSGCIEESSQNEEEASDILSGLAYKQYGFGINPPGEVQINKTTTIWETNWRMDESITGVIFTLGDNDSVTLSVYRSIFVQRVGVEIAEYNGVFVYPENKYKYEIEYYILDNQSLKEHATEKIEIYSKLLFTNMSFISNTTTTINGMNAYVSIFTGIWSDARLYKQKHVYVEKNDIVFNLIYSALESLYDEYIPVVDQSIDSFTIQ